MMKRIQYFVVLFILTFFSFLIQNSVTQAKTYKTGFSYRSLPYSVRTKITGHSYPEKKSLISYANLRYVTVKYIDFNGRTKKGELIVNKKIAAKTVRIFYDLYKIKYRIQRIRLIDEYQADDEMSMQANNTSAFNYRMIDGSTKLSYHGKGLAIDLNPRVNPCVKKGVVSPANAKVYSVRNVKKCRGKYRNYMIQKNDAVYKIFRKYGFFWGGDWNSLKDYQHFEYRK